MKINEQKEWNLNEIQILKREQKTKNKKSKRSIIPAYEFFSNHKFFPFNFVFTQDKGLPFIWH